VSEQSWFTNTIGSSVRYYYETAQLPRRFPAGRRIDLPCDFFLETPGLAWQPTRRTGRLGRNGPPPARPDRSYNIQRWFAGSCDGHLPAFEVPHILVQELRAYFAPLR
jgi:hypothetical protein